MSQVISNKDSGDDPYPDDLISGGSYDISGKYSMPEANAFHQVKDTPKPYLPVGTLDPIQILPAELVLQCLLEALPSRKQKYTSAVLDLLSVSTRWQDFVLSAPVLWKEVHLTLTMSDLLATTSLFVHCSGTIPLDVIFWSDMNLEWSGINSILVAHKERIHRLIYRVPHIYERSMELMSSRIISSMARLTSPLGFLSNLREADLGRSLTCGSSQLKPLGFPPTVYLKNLFNAPALLEDVERDGVECITRMEAFYPFDKLASALVAFENLSELHMGRSSEKERQLSRTPILTEVPLHLKSFIFHQPYCANVGRFLKLASSQLTYLDVEIYLSNFQETIENLKDLGALQVLRLGILRWEDPIPSFSSSCSVVTHGLHTLEITTELHSLTKVANYDSRPIVVLFNVFKALYPMVKRVEFQGVDDILDFAHQYLEGLTLLESVSIKRGVIKPSGNLHLRSLQSLSSRNPFLLPHLQVPNLLRLSVRQVTAGSQLTGLQMPSLRKLVIRLDDNKNVLLALDSNQYPHLYELDIKLHWYRHQWELTSFPSLETIYLDSSGILSPHGNRLCLSLIYNPESCPSLRHIRFTDFVEWDFLFLMLQRRNCGTRGVAKISSVTLVYVSPAFHQDLSDLLDGKPVDILGNEELRMEATREVIFDPNISGCIKCLKRMWPGCTEKVEELRNTPLSLERLFPIFESPPHTLPKEIINWMVQYKEMVAKWKAACVDFELNHYRPLGCTRG